MTHFQIESEFSGPLEDVSTAETAWVMGYFGYKTYHVGTRRWIREAVTTYVRAV